MLIVNYFTDQVEYIIENLDVLELDTYGGMETIKGARSGFVVLVPMEEEEPLASTSSREFLLEIELVILDGTRVKSIRCT